MSRKKTPKRPAMLGPQTERDQLFCERWLTHFDKDRAYREAGFSCANQHWRQYALSKLTKFADYLRPIKEAKAKIIAERLAVDSEKILAGMAQKVFFDPTSFYERSETPMTEWVEGAEGKDKVERVRAWHGRPLHAERLKPYSELTPEQQAVVEITNAEGERIHYRLPSIREQHTYLTSLGRQLGMFAEKLIMERHHHQHVHHQLDFEHVPTARIAAITRQLLPLVGIEFAQSLGYTAEDIAAAAQEDGVLMPEKSTA